MAGGGEKDPEVQENRNEAVPVEGGDEEHSDARNVNVGTTEPNDLCRTLLLTLSKQQQIQQNTQNQIDLLLGNWGSF